MPNNIITSFAQKSGRSEADVDHMWNSLKRELTSRGVSGDQLYQMIVGIMKKNLNIQENNMSLVDKHLKTKSPLNEAKETYHLDSYMSAVIQGSSGWRGRSWDVNGWTFELEYQSGSWRWEKEGGRHYVYASPYFDGAEGIAIQVHDAESDGVVKSYTVPFAVYGVPSKDISNYKKTMAKELKKVK
jgi:hypothetical protein